jgi:phospho-N-acetylmuramoyl-pentapeptide-transferase
MFYHLFLELSDQISGLNVFRYITFRTGGALMTALFLVFMFGPWLISKMRIKQGKGQPIREDGPARHILEKQGTPTMGGLMILASVLVSTLLWADLSNLYVWSVLFVTMGFGAIGFYDDYLKVTRAKTGGFSARFRLALEFIIAGIAVWMFTLVGDKQLSTALAFPFLKDVLLQLGWFFIVFGMVVVVGAGNAVNLTDGLDGLAIVPVMIAAASFGVIVYLAGNVKFADYLQIHYVRGTGELAVVCGAVIGASVWASCGSMRRRRMIFMGDTGSLALGGAAREPSPWRPSTKSCSPSWVACSCWKPVSVIIVQVVSFKLTGKRVFAHGAHSTITSSSLAGRSPPS